MTTGVAAAAIAAAIGFAGCGLRNPDTVNTRPPARPPVPVAPTGLRTPPSAGRGQRDLVRDAVEYTLTQATWSPDTYVSQQARLAAMSTGRALAQLAPRRGAPPAAVAAQLAAAGASSRATLIGTDRRSGGHDVVVVYRATATGVGRSSGQPDYAIAHVTLTPRPRGWLVSSFQVQP